MGLLDRFGLTTKRFDLLSSPEWSSPWATGNSLKAIVPSEIFGSVFDNAPLDRVAAMSIPAVSKARNLLISTIGRFPLVALDTKGRVATQPTFLYRTDNGISPYDRMAWTVDDLIFYGCSLWLVERGSNGQITDARWCPTSEWKVKDRRIQVNDKDVDESEVILFNSPFEGLLNVGARTLRGARDTELAWVARMESPAYMVDLHVTEDSTLSQTEVDDYVAAWNAKHKAGKASVGMTPPGIELTTHEGSLGSADLFLESRNAIRTDVGSFLNIRAAMLDGTTGVDSLTYTTSEGEKNSFYEFDLPFWTDPIAHRLSVDDVVPRGQRVRFDMYETYAAIPNPTGVPTDD